jgi:hypothetical protein
MKILKLSVLIVALSAWAFAQTEIPTQQHGLAIGSNIQKASMSEAWMSVAGQTAMTSVANTNSWTPGQGAEVLLSKCKFTITVETVSPDNDVTTQVVVGNGNDLLFEGYTTKRPTLVNGAWTLPRDAGEVTLNLGYLQWITFDSNVRDAYLVDGKGNWHRLAVNGRKVALARESLGLKNGAYLRVYFDDQANTVKAWTIETGAQLKTVPLTVTTSAKLANFFTFKNPLFSANTPATVTVPTVVNSVGNAVGISPSIEIEMTAAGSVWLKAATTQGKVPVGFRILSPSGKTTTTPGLPIPGGGFSFPLEAGRSYVVAMFKAGDCDEPSNAVATGGNGDKGSP